MWWSLPELLAISGSMARNGNTRHESSWHKIALQIFLHQLISGIVRPVYSPWQTQCSLTSQSAFGWPLPWSCLLWPWLVCCTLVRTIRPFTDSWKINFTDWRITLCSLLASNMCRLTLSRFYSDKSVLFIPLLSKVKATCCDKTAAVIIHQPWALISWIWIIPWGTSRVKYVGMVYLFLCLSSNSDMTSQQLWCFRMCHPEKFHIFPHISHYCEVPASQSTYWMSIWEHSWLLAFCCVSGSWSRYCYYKTTVWAERVSARGGTHPDNTCQRISVLVGK